MPWPKSVTPKFGETWGFHVPPLMELWVSTFYGTMETQGFQQYPNAGNLGFPWQCEPARNSGELAVFWNYFPSLGNSQFPCRGAVEATNENHPNLGNLGFPCRSTPWIARESMELQISMSWGDKSYQSLGKSGCSFRGVMENATQVSGHMGLPFCVMTKVSSHI